jgi:hypothetical protein
MVGRPDKKTVSVILCVLSYDRIKAFQNGEGDRRFDESLIQWTTLSKNEFLCNFILPWQAGRTKEQSVSYFVYDRIKAFSKCRWRWKV